MPRWRNEAQWRAEERNPLLASWRRSKERELASAHAVVAARRRRKIKVWGVRVGGVAGVAVVAVLTFWGRSPKSPSDTTGLPHASVDATAAEELARRYWPEATEAARQAGGLFFVAGNKYTLKGVQAPPGLDYPWLDTAAGEQIVEPFVETTLVALPDGAALSDPTVYANLGSTDAAANFATHNGSADGGAENENGSGTTFVWIIGDTGEYLTGAAVTVTFTTPNAAVDVTLHETDMATGAVHRSTTRRLAVRYVRREMRRLDAADLSRFLDAMEVTYRIPTSAGRAKYGDGYADAFYFVKQHNVLAGDTDCDAAHDGLGFLTMHIAMTLAYEKVLQTVDPAVALPYWDYTIEAARVEAAGSIDPFYDSEVFADDVLGGFGRAEDGYAIIDGRWARVPVDPASWPDGASAVTNGYGLIRSPWNQNPSPYVTRCRGMFGAEFDKVPTCSFHYDQMQINDWATFGMQIQYKPHGSMHTVTAGGWGVDYKAALLEWYGDERKANAIPLKAFGFQKDMWRYRLLQCPAAGSCTTTAATTAAMVGATAAGGDGAATAPAGGAATRGGGTMDGTAAAAAGANGTAAATGGGGVAAAAKAEACTCICESFDEWVTEGSATVQQKLAAINLLGTFKENSAGDDISEDLLRMFCNLGGEAPALGDAMSSAAPADWAFWPLHPTADRLWHWRRLNGMVDENWPSGSYMHSAAARGSCSGHDADDIVGYSGLFNSGGGDSSAGSNGGGGARGDGLAATSALEAGVGAGSGGSGFGGGFTNAELYALMDPALQNLPYVYDDFTWPHCAEQGYPLDLLHGDTAAAAATAGGGLSGSGGMGGAAPGSGGSGGGETASGPRTGGNAGSARNTGDGAPTAGTMD